MNQFFWVITDVANQSKADNIGNGQFDHAKHGQAWELTSRKRLEIASGFACHFRILDRSSQVIVRGKCTADGLDIPQTGPLIYCGAFIDPSAHKVEYHAKGEDAKALQSFMLLGADLSVAAALHAGENE